MNDPYVLRGGYYGPFLIWKLAADDRKLEVHGGFSKKSMQAYRMTLVIDPLAGITVDDVLNPELDPPEAARIDVYMAIEEYKDAGGVTQFRPYNGDAKNGNKLVIAQDKGRDFLRGDVFHAIVAAGGADNTNLGEVKPRAGLDKLKQVFVKVEALEGKGNYPARNVFRAWAIDLATFQAEDTTRAQALVASAHAVEGRPANADGTTASPLAAALAASTKPVEAKAPVAALGASKKAKPETPKL